MRRRPRRLTVVLRTLNGLANAKPGDDAGAYAALVDQPSTETDPTRSDAFPQTSPPTATDRRQFLRRKSTNTVRILHRGDITLPQHELEVALHSAPYRGQMIDVSMSGVAFLLNEPLSDTATVWVRLECSHRDFSVIRPAHVIRVLETDEDQWKIMCRFDQFLPHGDVTQLGHDIC